MAAARQNEMKVSITVVATKTFTAGFVLSGDVAMLERMAATAIKVEPFEDSTARGRAVYEQRRKVPSLPFLLRDPFVSAGVEHIERQGAAVEHLVVELTEIEFGTQLVLSAIAQFAELELAEFVAASLCRPRDVAVRLRLECGLIHRSRLAEEVDDLIAAPSLGVNPGVDDQTHGAEQFGGKPSVVGDGILIKTNFF